MSLLVLISCAQLPGAGFFVLTSVGISVLSKRLCMDGPVCARGVDVNKLPVSTASLPDCCKIGMSKAAG